MESNSEKDLKERFNEAEKQAKLGHNDRAHDMFTDVIERCQNYLTFSPNVQMPSNTVYVFSCGVHKTSFNIIK